MHRNKTVYAVAGNTTTILGLADEHNIPIPFECGDGNCGSCLIEVKSLEDKPKMGMALTEKEKARLTELQKITPEELVNAEVNDLPPRYRAPYQRILQQLKAGKELRGVLEDVRRCAQNA